MLATVLLAFLAGATVAVLPAPADAAAPVGFPPCPQGDHRTPRQLVPTPGVVIDGVPYEIVDRQLREFHLTKGIVFEAVAAWQFATGCDGDENHRGGWIADLWGGVETSGDWWDPRLGVPVIGHHGDMSGIPLNAPVVAMSPTADGGGYWLSAADGGIFTFGNARFYGSTGDMVLNQPVVGMASTATGNGYWMVASDGGIFCFGDAQFFGSMGGTPLNRPISAMIPTPTGQGYWMVADDGGIFTFGDAVFKGSLGDQSLGVPIAGMIPNDAGYALVTANRQVHWFG